MQAGVRSRRRGWRYGTVGTVVICLKINLNVCFYQICYNFNKMLLLQKGTVPMPAGSTVRAVQTPMVHVSSTGTVKRMRRADLEKARF